jgi:predicted regulator of Ras-like GTPase activity (Roadblock/LC7/MglB family)
MDLRLSDKKSDLIAALKAMIRNMGSMVSNLLKLSYLYVALFVIQVILLPIGTFWLLVRITNALCSTNIPYILKHADFGKQVKGETKKEKA